MIFHFPSRPRRLPGTHSAAGLAQAQRQTAVAPRPRESPREDGPRQVRRSFFFYRLSSKYSCSI